MTWLALHPWTLIVGMTLGLPLGMLLQRRHEQRAAARRQAKERAVQTERVMAWSKAQQDLDKALREAAESAEAEMMEQVRRDRLKWATICRCENCRALLQRHGAGPN